MEEVKDVDNAIRWKSRHAYLIIRPSKSIIKYY